MLFYTTIEELIEELIKELFLGKKQNVCFFFFENGIKVPPPGGTTFRVRRSVDKKVRFKARDAPIQRSGSDDHECCSPPGPERGFLKDNAPNLYYPLSRQRRGSVHPPRLPFQTFLDCLPLQGSLMPRDVAQWPKLKDDWNLDSTTGNKRGFFLFKCDAVNEKEGPGRRDGASSRPVRVLCAAPRLFGPSVLCVQSQLLLRHHFININNREVECSLDSYHVRCCHVHQLTQLKCVRCTGRRVLSTERSCGWQLD